MNDAWYVVASLFVTKTGEPYVSPHDPVSAGKDPAETVRRHRSQHEARMFDKDPSVDWAHDRKGKLFAVWRFEEKIPRPEVMDTIMRAPVWRVFVLTDEHSWGYMARLCLPTGVSVFQTDHVLEQQEQP